jgi:hypothetical protein
MPEYLLYFNQSWVAPSPAVVEEMKDAGVYVFAAGVEENGPIYTADPTQGDEVVVTDGPHVDLPDHIGGFAIVRVDDDEAAKYWAAKVAEGCGWPHEVRRVG